MRRSFEDRYASIRPALDGISFLSAALSSGDAVAVDRISTALAAAVAPAPKESARATVGCQRLVGYSPTSGAICSTSPNWAGFRPARWPWRSNSGTVCTNPSCTVPALAATSITSSRRRRARQQPSTWTVTADTIIGPNTWRPPNSPNRRPHNGLDHTDRPPLPRCGRTIHHRRMAHVTPSLTVETSRRPIMATGTIERCRSPCGGCAVT